MPKTQTSEKNAPFRTLLHVELFEEPPGHGKMTSSGGLLNGPLEPKSPIGSVHAQHFVHPFFDGRTA